MSLRFVMPFCAVAVALGCSSSSTDPPPAPSAPLRPGVEDSSQVYKGTPSPAESAFWEAVRKGDDTARADAETELRADIEKDPTNGYSEFLAGASMFMPSNDVLRALAAGTSLPPQGPPSAASVKLLAQGLSNLTDPLYVGFDAAFLGTMQSLGGDPATGAQTFALAQAKNPAASGFLSVTNSFRSQDAPGALKGMYALFEFCYGGPLDHDGGDVDKWVAKANAATLVHRECYSGYHSMHGTEGLLLLLGDSHALTGNKQAAGLYYAAMRTAANYPTWPLKPLAERRIRGAEPAVAAKMNALTGCPTCHTMALP